MDNSGPCRGCDAARSNLPWKIKKMTQVVHRFRWNGSPEDRLEELVDREWPVIKGLCGYASATLSPLG
jgi:hypothetical protein